MSKTLKKLWEIVIALREANYAAHLARNGQWKKAQQVALNTKES